MANTRWLGFPHLRVCFLVKSECQVYTLGTGLWRRIGICGRFEHRVEDSAMPLLCGNLHWWWKSTAALQISRLDLETESFSTISGPPSDDGYKERCLSSLKGCLCVCDGRIRVIDIWMMKEYGDEWTKEFCILKSIISGSLEQLDPIEVLKNGDMFMSRRMGQLLYYPATLKLLKKLMLIEVIQTTTHST